MKPYRKPVSLALVLAVFAAFAMAAATTTPASTDFIPDTLRTQLASDAAAFNRLAGDSVLKATLFQKKSDELKRRGNLTPQEIASLQADANALKGQLGTLKNAANSIIDKLRGANKLSGELDAFIDGSVRAKKPEAADKLRNQGGARAALAALSANLSEAINEITRIQADPAFRTQRGSLQQGRQLGDHRLIPVAYAPAAPPVRFAITVIKCSVFAVELIIKTIQKVDTEPASDNLKHCDD